ncbi:MAG: hypothetical protein MJZ26_04660 [Fibrobacter sp.]|nr:hypothetical protein [Fibrobacter sp.]
MNFKKFASIASVALAFALPTWAQDSDSDDEWASAASAPEATAEEAPAEEGATYDGSADSEFADDEEYASAYAKYKAEGTKKADINKQRNEGFSRSVLLGVRAQVGTNTFFGENSDGWNMGFQGGAGLMLKMNLGVKNLSLVPELTFNYRYYTYEKDMEIYTNEASIDIFMFEIPVIVRYTFEDLGVYVGLGVNLGLKLNGTSEFSSSGGTRENTVATSGMEVGGALDIGYMLTRWVSVDIRAVQCFTSLLNKTLVAEETFYESSLNTFSLTAGVNFMF